MAVQYNRGGGYPTSTKKLWRVAMKVRSVSVSFVMLFVLGTLTSAVAQVTSVAAGTGMSFPTITTSGTVSIDTTKVPLLNTANTFTGNQSVTGSLSATGAVTGSAFNINQGSWGTYQFASGTYTTGNAFLGFSGTRGSTYDTATGFNAMLNTTGNFDTANGVAALFWQTSGDENTGLGYGAGNPNTGNTPYTTGFNNTFLGSLTSPGARTNLNNATAVGAYAEVDASNALVLGSINGVNNCDTAHKCNSTFVGIGTTTPVYLLHIGNSGGGSFNNFLRVEGPKTPGTGGNAASFGGLGAFSIDAPNLPGGRFIVTESGRVGIGVENPGHPLHLVDGAYEDHGTWTNSSDRSLKAGFAPVDGTDLLVRLDAVPMLKWRYKSERDSIRHIGPTAQDFYAAFGLGSDDKHITTVDEGGVALAAVQALYRENLKLFEATKQQQTLIEKQQVQIARLSQQVKTIQAAFKTSGRGSEVHTVRAKATLLHQ
jgi:hypothetical protein